MSLFHEVREQAAKEAILDIYENPVTLAELGTPYHERAHDDETSSRQGTQGMEPDSL